MKTVALALLVAALAGCGGGNGDGPPDAPAPELSDRLVDFSIGPPYVNSLDVDPASGEYLLTTNRGFWRIDPETDEVTRVRGTVTAGRRRSPVGSFLLLVVTGPGRLVGSGHPDRQDALPEYLGVIESADGGRSWRVVSRLGETDLHAIVVKHDRLYGFDAVQGTLLVSRNGGRTFAEHPTPPGAIVDAEVDPADPDRIFAATDQGLFRSEDGGDGWRPLDQEPGIRLAWPARDAFYRTGLDGTVQRSRDGGASWQPVGRVAGEPHEVKALSGERLLLALADGTVLESDDGGRNWTEAFRP